MGKMDGREDQTFRDNIQNQYFDHKKTSKCGKSERRMPTDKWLTVA